MAKEILAVPESQLREVIAVLRVGMEHIDVTQETRTALHTWCNDEETYADELGMARAWQRNPRQRAHDAWRDWDEEEIKLELEAAERLYQRGEVDASDWRAPHNRIGACSDRPGELWIWIKNRDADVQAAPLSPAMASALGEWLLDRARPTSSQGDS